MELKVASVTYNGNRANDINLNLAGTLMVSEDNFDLGLEAQSRLRAVTVVIPSGETRSGETRSGETRSGETRPGETRISDLTVTPVLSATRKESILLPGFSIQARGLVMDDLEITHLDLAPRQPVTLGSELRPLLNQPFGNWHVEFDVTYADSFAASSRLNVNVLNLDPDNLPGNPAFSRGRFCRTDVDQ
jgi:hypothetical protein